MELGFIQSLVDLYLYIYYKKQVQLFIYVDDIPAATKTKNKLFQFYKKLFTRFNAKDLKEISKVLSVQIIKDRKQYIIYLD